jgi:hypothetical protein
MIEVLEFDFDGQCVGVGDLNARVWPLVKVNGAFLRHGKPMQRPLVRVTFLRNLSSLFPSARLTNFDELRQH